MWNAFAWLGAGVAFIVAVAAVFVGGVALAFYAPRLNCGRPPNYCEFRAAKSADDDPFNRFKIKWWLGLSSRLRPRWFLGMMRWDRID